MSDMRKFIRIVESTGAKTHGLHSGWPANEEADEFNAKLLGPTGTFDLYHASGKRIEQFRPFTHFGTEAAARQRASDLGLKPGSAFLHRVRLNVSKSLWVTDSGTTRHELRGLMEYLETILNLDFWEVSEASRSATRAVKLLARYGYDALAYRNGHEDLGSTSWIGLDPKKAAIIEVTPI